MKTSNPTSTLIEQAANHAFLQAGEASWNEAERSGLHTTLDEAKQWVTALKRDPKTPLPACHQ